jgi:hypothetical protein
MPEHYSRRAVRNQAHRRGAAALLLCTATVLLGGCGYRAGGPFRADVKTVYVDMVGSREFRRDLEFTLTEALKKRIATDTPYKLASRDKADTILQAEVLEERQSAYAEDYESRQPRQKTATFTVKVRWKDVRSGRVLVEQPALLQSVDYIPPAGETERFAQERAMDKMAARIVALLYEDF